jgi:hypothetical protein
MTAPARSPRRLRAPSLSPRGEVAAVAAFFAAYAVLLTWPVALHPGGTIYGVPGGDLTGGIANLRELVEHHVFPFAPGRLSDFDAPWGQPVQWALNLASAPSTLLLLVLGYLLGPTAAYSGFLLLGFVGSGVAMFLLARRVTSSSGAALVAGFGFAFYPFAINKGLDHVHFVHGWPFVLMTWRLLELVEAPTRRNGLLLGAATVLTMWFTPYYMLIGGVLFATLAIVGLVAAARRRAARAMVVSSALATVSVLVFLAVLGGIQQLAGAQAGTTQTNLLSSIIRFSARPYQYLIPDRNSLLFGDRTEPFLLGRLGGPSWSEHSLYLGGTLLLLAAVGVVTTLALVARRRALPASRPTAVAVAASASCVAFVFSMPPEVTVRGRLIKFPMWLVLQVTSTFRSVSRFAIVVEMGVCILAAIGLAALLPRRGVAVRGAVAAFALIVVAVDLWARPPGAVSKLVPPTVYQRARSLGPGILAEYPLLAGDLTPSASLFWQDVQGHRVLQGYVRYSESESRKIELARLDDRETPGDLRALGVRWVLVRPNSLSGAAGRGFRKVIDDPSASVYEVTAPASPTQVDALSGFGFPLGGPNQQVRWLEKPQGRVLVRGDCDPCRGRLSFASASHMRPRTLTIRDGAGRLLMRRTVPPVQTQITVPLAVHRQAVLTFAVTPPPEPAGAGDPRLWGIYMLEPRFVIGGKASR